MLLPAFDRVTALFHKHFIISAWGPVAVSVAAAISAVAVGALGVDRTVELWVELSATAKIWIGVLGVLATTVLALLLQTNVLVPVFGGYRFPYRVAEQGRRWHHQRSLPRGASSVRDVQNPSYFQFPMATAEREADRSEIAPTRLGNVIRAAETYSNHRYGLDGPFWWPRLWAAMPGEQRERVNETLLVVVTQVNLSFAVSVSALAASVVLALTVPGWVWPLAVLLMGLGVGATAYQAACRAAIDYGNALRTSYDLYRTRILEQLRVHPPGDPLAERRLWAGLQHWLYSGEWPPVVDQAGAPAMDGVELLRYGPPPPSPPTARGLKVRVLRVFGRVPPPEGP